MNLTHLRAADVGRAPAITHVVEAVEHGGTLTVLGTGLSNGVRVWGWQPKNPGSSLSDAEIDDLRQRFAQFPTVPEYPAKPPAEARILSRLGSTGDPRVLMVQQAGSAQPAGDDSHILPTLLWLEAEGRFSKPYLVNAPQLWFASERTVVPGERVRLFGINLFGGPKNPAQSLVALRNEETGEMFWGRQLLGYNQEHANVRQHELHFRLPPAIVPGSYTVRVHPLVGGDFGWSDLLFLRVAEQRNWVAQLGRADENRRGTPQSTPLPLAPMVIRVSGAAGDGVADDGPVIQRVLDEATAAGGGIVVLPAGRFAVTGTLNIPAGVVLQGAGREASSLTVSPLAPLKAGAGSAIVRLRTRTGLQDLSVIAGPGVEVNVLVEDATLVEDTFLRRVRIENTHAYLWDRKTTKWQNPDFGLLVNASTLGFRLLQTEIVAPMTFRMEGYGRRHRHAHMAGNRFETFPRYQQDNVFLLTLSESIFENNTMTRGHRAFTSQRGLWRNYIAHNQAVDIRGVGNGSEVFMSEYGGVLYDGPVVHSDTEWGTLRLPEDVSPALLEKLQSYRTEHELYAFFVEGAGFGQFRRVMAQTERVLHLQQPLLVQPDSTSQVLLLGATTRNLLINNSASGGRAVFTFFYGSAMENFLVGNEASVGGVISFWPCAVAHEQDSALLAFNTFANNRLVQNGGMNIAALDWEPQRGRPPLAMANRLVRNQVWRPGDYGSPNQYYAFWNWQGGANAGHGWVEPGPRQAISIWNGSFNVVENNYIDDAEIGMYAGPGRGVGSARSPVQGNVFRWNRVDRTKRIMADHGENTFIEPPGYQEYQ